MTTLIDMIGERFGRLVVLERGQRVSGHTHWVCRCDCGETKVVRAQYLRDGRVQSCGCYRNEQTSQRTIVRLDGQVFGRLTVEALTDDRREGQAIWRCVCSCGRVVAVRGKDLRSGHSESCGCLAVERARDALVREVVTYRGVHRRLRTERGPASAHTCVDCGATADDWSYTGGAADERREQRGPWLVRFSHDLSRYVPRCRRCHNVFDHPAGATS